ncbi:MAG: hypothetical protein ACYC96_07095 [Fimbriimonadaceae bacterium]
MKKVILAVLVGIPLVCVVGCNSDSTATHTVQATPAPKGSQTDAIKSNPNIPEEAKRGIIGSQGGH